MIQSQPARAVWIEIVPDMIKEGVRACHSLRGLCGLKFQDAFGNVRCCLSQPARAVWIEI